MLLIRVFDRGVEEEDRDSNTATTFIRQKEGWISDEISQWTYYINPYGNAESDPHQKMITIGYSENDPHMN